MRKTLLATVRVLGWMLAFGLAAVLAVGALRELAGDDADRDALALMTTAPPVPKGTNGFAALMLAGHAVPAERRDAVLAADVAAFARWQAERAHAAGLFDDASPGEPEELAAFAPLAGVPPRAERPAADELCALAGSDCLARAHADPDGTRELLARHAERIAAADAALAADHLASPYAAAVEAPLPRYDDLRLPLAAAAILAVDGDERAAYARTCRRLADARRMDRQATQLVDKMVAQALARGAATLLLDLRRRHPVDALPGACAAARMPVDVAEASVCAAMRGEFRLQRAHAARMAAQLQGWRPDRLLTRLLLVDDDLHARSDARALSPYCTGEAQRLATRGLVAEAPERTLRGVECWSAYVTCVLARIAAPSFAPYAGKAQDHAAVLRLLLAAQRVADGRVSPAVAAADAAVEGYPVAFDAASQRASVALRAGGADDTFSVEFAGLATMPDLSTTSAIALAGAAVSAEPLPAPLEALSTPLAFADAHGTIVACNAAFASWLGVGVRRLQGLALADLDAEQGRLVELLPRLPEAGAAVRVRRARLAFPGAAERFADLWVARGEDGGVRLEAHPAEEFPGEDPATALPAALSAALRGLAHEVRNPLAGLKGAAQLLARRVEGDESRELVALIGSEVDRLADLVDRLLNPAPPRAFAPTNIHAVLERVRQLAEVEAGWAVKLVRDFDPSLPEFAGDADRLAQALWNLVRNALESGASQVALRTRAEHHVLIGDRAHRLALRVEIADDGRGVPEDLAERIFLPLVSGRAEGTGLGLPLAQQVAREHGGSLGYRSRPGHTVFTLLLPVLDEQEVVEGSK